MKFNRTLLGLSLSLALVACHDNQVKNIETKALLDNLKNPNYVIIDSRQDSYYNGFKDKNATRGGHIPGAIQFSCSWLNWIAPDKFESFAAGKGITKDKTLVFYDTNPDNLACISAEFANKGYKTQVFNDFLSYANADYPLESFPNFQYSVSPEWINAVTKGEKPETYNNDKFAIFEVSWGPLDKSQGYVQHIVGAYHFDTDWIENGPIWNLSSPDVIEQNLLKNGITADKTIILYSDNQLAAYRVFWVLKWAGLHIPQRALADGLLRHFFQAQALGAKLDFIHRVGFWLAEFVFRGFQTACFCFYFHQIQHAADAQLLRRHMHRPLKMHTLARFRLARIHPLMQLLTLRGQIILRPRLLVVNQRALAQVKGVVLQGGKGKQARVLIFPLGFG